VIGTRLIGRSPLRLAALLGLLCVAAGYRPAEAVGNTIGAVPPANPAANCVPSDTLTASLGMIDYCRAQEEVGPVTLPTNWSSLTPEQQMLVIFDLERIGRGLPPIVGLNSQLDGLAQTAANDNEDPTFPPSGTEDGGSVWAAASSTLDADYEWMYYDGPGGINVDCSSTDTSRCWGHRDNILIDSSDDQLIGGAGYAADSLDGIYNSYAFEMDYDAGSPANYPPDDFTWSSELSYFPSAPGTGPLPVPTITSVSPSSGTTAGGTTSTYTAPTTTATTTTSTTTHSTGTAPTTTTTVPATTIPPSMGLTVSPRRIVGHKVSFTIRFLSGSATVSAVATRGAGQVRLRTLTSRRSVAVSGVLGAGRWTITLRYTPHDGVSGRFRSVLHITIR